MPFVDRDLAGQDGRAAAVAFFEDFVEIAAGAGIEGIEPPIIEDEELGAGHGSHDAGMAAVAAGRCEIGKQLGDCRGRLYGQWHRPASFCRRRSAPRGSLVRSVVPHWL